MQMADLDEVMAIEMMAHTHPWSRGNFIDSLTHGYDAWIVRSVDNVMLGYFVQMPVVDEAHLLTIAVKEEMQGRGAGKFLLKHVVERAKALQLAAVTLEVRVSNLRALAVYKTMGFLLVGCRKNYYEVGPGQREDALILRYVI
jgi:[ribosomal protein S18]-alanine N-acetyltransferase